MPVPPNPPCSLKPEDGVRPGISYETIRHINRGQMANAYEAKDSEGNLVFLKAYISPTPAVDWYRAYISYVRKVNLRIATATVSTYCEQAIDTFEAKVGHSKHATFFQVYDFVGGGHDLESILRRAATTPASLSWSQRVSMAKVILSSLKQLHEAGIVHCDLKPANVIMERVDALIGFRPKLIDLDSSILADTEAPWHGKEGYVGTPNYYSPEHLRGGNSKPLKASDVFTSTLILYDLLGQGNPYQSDELGDYSKKIFADEPTPIRLKGSFANFTDETKLADLLKRALSQEPATRPTMKEIHQFLGGVNVAADPPLPPSPPPKIPPRPEPTPDPTPSGPAVCRIELRGDKSGVDFGVTMTVGHNLLKTISSGGVFASEPQFQLISRQPDWFLKPEVSARNSTAINNKIVMSEQKLSKGDTICLIGKHGKRAMEVSISFK